MKVSIFLFGISVIVHYMFFTINEYREGEK